MGAGDCIDNNQKRPRRAFFKLFSRSEPLPSRRRYTGRAKPTLKAGSNIIYIHAPGATTLDAADIDAINVLPKGKGAPPLATPVMLGD